MSYYKQMNELIEKYIKYLEIEKKVSKHTLIAYRNDLEQFYDFSKKQLINHEDEKGSINIEDITRPIMRLWIGELSDKGMSRNSIARKTAAIRSFFKFCFKKGYIEYNPAQLLIIPKREKLLPHTAAEQDIVTMMELVDDSEPWGKQELAILELLYGTGIRLSELVSINLQDIDWNQHLIRILGKGAKQRIVPFGGQSYFTLEKHLESRIFFLREDSGSDARQSLFLSKRGRRIYPRAVQRIVQHYLNLASEVTQKSPHTLRHSFATHLLNHGANIRDIKELLGHSNLAATQVYTYTSVERLRKVYEQAHPRAKAD